MSTASSYEEAVAAHEWQVPEKYNIAVDVCDKHDAGKLAMVHEDPDGNVREVKWGELQELSNRFANVLRAHGVERGDRVAMLLPPTPETAAAFFGTYKSGAILLSMSVLYGDDGIKHRVTDSQAKVLVTNEANKDRVDPSLVEHVLILDDDLLQSGDAVVRRGRHRGRRPRAALLLLRHHRARQGHRPRAPLPARARGVRLLPRRAGRRALPRHGRVGVGGRHRAAARAVALRRGPARAQRKGGFDPHKQLDFLSRHEATNVFTTPTAMRSMMGIEKAGEKYPQKFRIVCSAGEPLNPEAIRWFREQYGVTVLDYYGLTESYPLVANYPFMDVREGSMGKPMPGWDVQILDEDEKPLPQGERGEICLRARSNPHYPIGYWNNPKDSEETFGGDWFHTKDAASLDEDGYVWYEGRADDVIIAAGYRIGPFEVESALLEHACVAEAAAVASPDERRGNVVKAFIVLAEGKEGSDELVDEIKGFVRQRLSAYAYPRKIEFVDELPKTLTGKIRRIELRQAEVEAAKQG